MKDMELDKIKVLHIIASRVLGGAERVLLTLSRKIDREKFDLVLGIFVNQRKSTDPLWKEAEKLDLPLEPIRIKNRYGLLQILDLFRIMRKHHPDIIHTHGYKTNILGFLVAKLFGMPIVTTVHGLYPSKRKTELFVNLSLILLRHFDIIIVVSDQIKATLKNKKIPLEKMTTISNVPPIRNKESSSNVNAFREEIGISSDAKLIGFVGRLEHVKGCAQLIQAISQLADSHSDYYFVIVGEGPERESLERQVRELDLEKQIYFCGFRDDVKYVFQSLDLYVLPSLNEGVPLALLEAMLHGVPVVATRVGGVPEVIQDRVNGILVPPNDPGALIKNILESLSNQDETAVRVLEAKRTISREYNVKNWIGKIENIYTKLVAPHSNKFSWPYVSKDWDHYDNNRVHSKPPH